MSARERSTGAAGGGADETLSMAQWSSVLGLLSDPHRVRLLRALSRHELAVGEAGRALQMPQSTVSRQLKLLFDGKMLQRRVEGTTSLYRVDRDGMPAAVRSLWKLAQASLARAADLEQDDARLTAVIAARRAGNGFFSRVGGDWDIIRNELFGSLVGWEAALGLLQPNAVVADLGCGTGEIAERIAPYVGKVFAVDSERAMIAAARQRLSRHSNVVCTEGDLMHPPIRSGTIDAAVVSLVLHHVADPAAAVRATSRLLKPGGSLLLIDMIAHARGDYRSTMGHRHLGFSQGDVRRWAEAAGLRMERWHRIVPAIEAKGPGLFSALLRGASGSGGASGRSRSSRRSSSG